MAEEAVRQSYKNATGQLTIPGVGKNEKGKGPGYAKGGAVKKGKGGGMKKTPC